MKEDKDSVKSLIKKGKVLRKKINEALTEYFSPVPNFDCLKSQEQLYQEKLKKARILFMFLDFKKLKNIKDRNQS